MSNQILFLVAAFILRPDLALAGVSAFTGTSGEKVFIESADKEMSFIKIEGLKSAWTDKVFKTKKESSQSGDKYSFDYEIELSDGKLTRTYTPVVFDGETLVQGTVVKKIKLYVSGGPKGGTSMAWNEALTNSSQNIDLAKQFKKSPFVPEVD